MVTLYSLRLYLLCLCLLCQVQEEAAEAFPAAEVGQVYVVLQPTPRQGAGLSFSVQGAEQLRLVGVGLDWRRCKARRAEHLIHHTLSTILRTPYPPCSGC